MLTAEKHHIKRGGRKLRKYFQNVVELAVGALLNC